MLIFSLCFAIFLTVVVPIILSLWLCRRKKLIWKPLLAGALCFTVFQLLTRIPLLNYVIERQRWYVIFSTLHPTLYILFLALTAALFEELGRYFVMRYFLKSQRSCGDAIVFGLGHGGIESVAGGANFVFYLIIQLTNPANFPGILLPSAVFASCFERLMAMVIHIALSVMVMKSLREKAPWYLVLALFLHTALDFFSVYLFRFFYDKIWVLEGLIFLFAAAMAAFVVVQYKKFTATKSE